MGVPETACIAYFTPQALDSIEAYVGVSNDPCTEPFVYNCGRPLTNLNLPPAPATSGRGRSSRGTSRRKVPRYE